MDAQYYALKRFAFKPLPKLGDGSSAAPCMVGFVAAVVLVAYLPRLPSAAWLLLSALLGTIFCARGCTLLWTLPGPWQGACRRPWWPLLRPGLVGVLLGLILATWFGNSMLDRRLPAGCVRQPVAVQGTVVSLPVLRQIDEDTVLQRFELRVRAVTPDACAGPHRILLSYYGDATVRPGETWRFAARLKRPWGLANPGSHNMQAWFAQTGIDATGSTSSGTRLSEVAAGATMHHRARYLLSRRIEQLPFRPDVIAVLKALTIADKSGVDGSLWRLFQVYGVNHLLVISGLHIGLVAGLGYLLGGPVARLAGVRARYFPALLALSSAVFYAALAGFSLPTQRALCMLVAPVVAVLMGRASGAANTLLLAAVCVLLVNPLAVLGSGFWLSFGAVAMLLWIHCWHREEGLLRGLVRGHASMALMMMPVTAWFFGGASLVSAGANLLLIPLVGFVIVPAALAAAVFEVANIPLSLPLWQLAAWPVDHLLLAAQSLAEGAGDGMYRQAVPRWYELVFALVAAQLLTSPAGVQLKLVALALLLPLFVASHPGDTEDSRLLVAVLDVGQGTAVVLKQGRNVLVYDTGGGDPKGSNLARTVLVPYLRQLRVDALDTVVISHADLDHSAGAASLLGEFPVQRLRYSGRPPGIEDGRACRAGEAWRWSESVTFQVLSPGPRERLDSNDLSCVLYISAHGYHLLFPGDIESARERDLVRYWRGRLHSEFLLVAHHGSRTSSTWSLIKQLRPRLAVVSAGYANRFGHPHSRVSERFESLGTKVLNTADKGALEFVVGPEGVQSVDSYREKYHQYWM